eukprot:12933378-Prorocentrum_lima.AAC.1
MSPPLNWLDPSGKWWASLDHMDPAAEAANAPATYRGVPNACKQEYADFTEELCRALTRAHACADERME